ncbi:MAG: hypothetical protein C0469_07705 [Cyanobacteria bacterium DS2.3.42]|nr:hypothetical protein [Cyanobacteria bacterium DS2.3.42]
MSIPNLTPPYPDLPDGYVITQAEWNGQLNSIFNYCNGQVKPAIDALQSAPPPSVGAQAFFNARMTLESGVDCSVLDQSNKSTMYLTPSGGNLIGLYDTVTSTWSNYPFSEISIPVPAGARQLFDLFVRQTAGVCSLEIGAYNTVTASNSPVAGKPVVINMASTANFQVGDIISITSAGGSEEAVVTVVTTNVSITVDWLEFSHTTPTICSNVPTNALALRDGILVKASDHSRRYCGTWMNLASGQTSDTRAARLVANFYNRVPRPFEAFPTADTWNAGSTSWQQLGGTKALGEYRNLLVNADAAYMTIDGSHSRGCVQNGAYIGTTLDQTLSNTSDAFYGTVVNQVGDEDDGAFQHDYKFATRTRGRHILNALAFTSVTGKDFVNRITASGGKIFRIGNMQGTVLN